MVDPAALPLWLYGYAGAFVLVHGTVLYYIYRSSGSSSADSSSDPVETARVVCDHCGAENEVGYRYCRNCVQELSGTGGTGDAEQLADTRESL